MTKEEKNVFRLALALSGAGAGWYLSDKVFGNDKTTKALTAAAGGLGGFTLADALAETEDRSQQTNNRKLGSGASDLGWWAGTAAVPAAAGTAVGGIPHAYQAYSGAAGRNLPFGGRAYNTAHATALHDAANNAISGIRFHNLGDRQAAYAAAVLTPAVTDEAARVARTATQPKLGQNFRRGAITTAVVAMAPYMRRLAERMYTTVSGGMSDPMNKERYE
jgi:hypothetical protein